MSKRNHYVVRSGDAWGVRGEGGERLVRRTQTQAEAIRLGRDLASRSGGELRIQGMDGKFREAWSYGNDPFPPKG